MGGTENINDDDEALLVSQYAQYKNPDTRTAKWNTALIS